VRGRARPATPHPEPSLSHPGPSGAADRTLGLHRRDAGEAASPVFADEMKKDVGDYNDDDYVQQVPTEPYRVILRPPGRLDYVLVSTSPLEKYANFLLTLIEGQPDLTLDEVVCACASASFLVVAPRCGASFSATYGAPRSQVVSRR
jgi:hypothetical protein